MKIQGVITALITPFINGELDEEGLADNILYQMSYGINGILLLGTTGEPATLTPQEEHKVISIAVRKAKGKLPVWVGTGTYSTKLTIEKTKKAKDLGADIALIVTPYYNKPTQEGIFRHFEAITSAVDIPIVVYNIPGRCGTNIETPTLLRIAGLPNVIGVKEASGSIIQAGDVIHSVTGRHPNFSVLCGDDALTLPMISMGALGIISVVSNLVPGQIVALTRAALEGNFDSAKEWHYKLLPLYKAAFIETNPVPIKTAMNLCGLSAGECRLPLYQMAPDNINQLRQLLIQMQLISTQGLQYEKKSELNSLKSQLLIS